MHWVIKGQALNQSTITCIKEHVPSALDWEHIKHFEHINTVTVNSQYKPQINKLMYHYMIAITSGRFFIMNASEYLLIAHEFSIWNASVAVLKFWTEELDPQTISTTINRVYTAFFNSDSAQHLLHVEKEVLFSHFMKTLNGAFK